MHKIKILVGWGVILYSSLAYAVMQTGANDCAIQADGKVVAVGAISANNSSQFGVARYTTAGTLDTSYGTSGVIITTIGLYAQAMGVAIQPTNEEAVVAGYSTTTNGNMEIVIARYTTAGVLDTTFGSNGIVTTSVGEGAAAFSITLDANNNILVAGESVQSGAPQFLIARYTSTGSLDTSFGTGGIVTVPIGMKAQAYSLFVQPSDGKIVVGGFSSDGLTGEQVTLIRLNADGTLDTTFGSSGIIITPIGTQSHINFMVLQSDGSIVAVGFSDASYLLIRYTSTGIVDNTFGTNGVITVPLGSVARLQDVALDSNNNIVATGYSDTNLLIVRYAPTGELDTTFNGSGYVTLGLEATNIGNTIAVQSSDGKIIVGGAGYEDFIVARYDSVGSADVTWGSGGIITQPKTSYSTLITRIWEEEPSGTNGGTFTAGAWQTRVLNGLSTYDQNISLVNNEFTLGVGKYDILIAAPAYRVGNHQARLQNVTDGITAAYGSTVFSNNSIGTVSASIIGAAIAVLKPTTFQIQHYCTLTEASDGFGIAAGIGTAEIYTQVKITPT